MPKLFTSFLLACLAVGSTPARAQEGVFASPRIVAPIDDSDLITLQGNVHPLATAANDQGSASGSLELGRAILVLKSSAAQQAALNKLTDDQQNSKSPSYHAWLTPEEYGARFGVAMEDLEKITFWLESHGFTVEPQMAGRNLIMFSGTNAQLMQAFHTELHTYKVNGLNYTAISANPQIPAAFSDVVLGFSPNNFPVHAQHTVPRKMNHTNAGWKDVAGVKPQATLPDGNGGFEYAVTPYDLATIYNILPLWNAGIDGTGETIAIVADSNINPADVDTFRTDFGLPPKKLNIIVYGPDPGPNGDEDEADLDVQWSGAVAKNATIDLVVANDSYASSGIFGSAAYIINNNVAPLLNVSFGACEQAFGTAENQFINLIWEQAASQGITVLVASGDADAAGCDRGSSIAYYGDAANGLSSTPYNVSVGGTDFSGNFPDPTKYWSATNNPTTEQSVLSYIPETPWSDSCANPLILNALRVNGTTTDATTMDLCNDDSPQVQPYLNTIGGGGAASNCAVGGPDPTNPCISGYPKPAWQSGVPGIPADGVRDTPDVSLMSGNGIWGSFYLACDSDASGGPCDSTFYLAAGGTSFATPIFAGMLALAEQKQQAAGLGNVNYVLYKLGAAEYAKPSTACASSNVAAGNSCIFYDITQGSNATPCLIFTPDCNTGNAIEQLGILTGYDANQGYDLASGLGTINAYNLVENWNSASSTFLPTTTVISVTGPASVVYGQTLSLSVVVSPVVPATGVPSGDVGFTSNDTAPSSMSLTDVTLSNGKGAAAAAPVSAGSYQVFGNYAGDATFAPSTSKGLSVNITKATPGIVLTSTRSSVQSGQNVTFSLEASSVLNGVVPSGTVVFTNTATGAVLTNEGLPESSTFNGITTATWFATAPQSQLQSGANTITASYSGDSNYLGVVAGPTTVTDTQTAFTTALGQPSLTLTNGAGTLSVSVTPSGSTPLAPNSIVLSCPSAVGLTCTFSPNAVTSSGALTSTLSVQLAPSSLHAAAPKAGGPNAKLAAVSLAGGLAGLLFLIVPKRRRNYRLLPLCVLMLSGLMLAPGCGSAMHSSSVSQPSLAATTTVLSVNSTTPLAGSSTVFTAQVKPVSGKGVPTGTVTFAAGTARLGDSPLTGGSATFTTKSLPLGSQAVIATYSGDSAYDTSSSAVTLLNVSENVALTVTATDAFGNQSSAKVTVTIQ
jgi:hypothetical protein